MSDEVKYIASWSGGKDSTASIILAHEHNEPLDLIIFSEVMFDENISGELPEHIDFIKNKAIPLFESWGYEVKILHSEKTYMDCFHHRTVRGKRVGMKKGFVMSGHCDVQRDCKLKPITKFLKEHKDVTQYVGIAIDEPKRLERLSGTNRISLLEKYNYTEQMAYEICDKYDLLSPVYDFSSRGGCWFCPNMKKNELQRLRSKHGSLWNKLIGLELVPETIGRIWNILTGASIHQKEDEFFRDDQELKIFDFEEGIGMNRLFVMFAVNDLMYGIPAEVVAYDYADHVAARDNSFKEAFNKMLDYFDKRDPVFENWVKEHLTVEDVIDTLVLLQCDEKQIDWVDNKNVEVCKNEIRYGYFSFSDTQEVDE